MPWYDPPQTAIEEALQWVQHNLGTEETMTEQQTVRDIHDLMAQGQVEKPVQLLGQDEKQALADAGTSFIVNSIEMGTDEQFGPYWQVSGTLDGNPIQFRLSQHDRRDAFMQSLATAVAAGPIGGLRLKSYKGSAGNAFITVEPA